MYVEIIVTYGDKEEAKKISKYLLENRLISCAQAIDIKSLYWWNNEIVDDKEIQVIMKTKKTLANEVVKYVKENHSYEVPEIIERTIEHANEEYLNWIETETKKVGW